MKHNNPVDIATWEVQRIWPRYAKPDLVLSLGTGRVKVSNAPSERSGLISRLWQVFMTSIDAESAWWRVMNRLNDAKRKDYLRLNFELPDSMVDLDDVTCMEHVRGLLHSQPKLNQDCRVVVASLLASSFYFALDSRPCYSAGSWLCTGVILCQLPRLAIQEILVALGKKGWTFSITGVKRYFPSPCDPLRDRCWECERYEKPIDFRVNQLVDDICIYMKHEKNPATEQTEYPPRAIGAFPTNVEWFMEQQGLTRDFATSVPRNAGGPPCQTAKQGVKRSCPTTRAENTGLRKRPRQLDM